MKEPFQVKSIRRTASTPKVFLLAILIGLFACQSEKAPEETLPTQEKEAISISNSSDERLEALKKSYERKIDSLLDLQKNADAELQDKVATLTKEAEALAAYNQNLDQQVDQQANNIRRLQDSLQAVLDENNETFEVPFNAVALTEASLDSLVDATEPTLESFSFGALEKDFESDAFTREIDSLAREIDKSKSEAAVQDKRLDGILSNLAIAMEPKSQKSGKGYEDVIINTLLSTVSDDTLIVNQYNRGFYTKQDLNAMVSDYKVRKTNTVTAGELVLYRRKKKQDQKAAAVYIDGKSFRFNRNQIDTVEVRNVFEVQVCNAKDQCQLMAFSSQMTNYVEISLSKNTDTTEIKPVNQVLGEFYARQVNSARKEK